MIWVIIQLINQILSYSTQYTVLLFIYWPSKYAKTLSHFGHFSSYHVFNGTKSLLLLMV